MDDIVDLVSRSDDDLRALVAELEAEEREISRQRRILQGKLDILRAELVMRLQRRHNEGESVISADDVEGLSRILAGKMPQDAVEAGWPHARGDCREHVDEGSQDEQDDEKDHHQPEEEYECERNQAGSLGEDGRRTQRLARRRGW